MTPIQHGLLRFTLGLDRRKTANRNALATGPDEDTFRDVQELVLAGFMASGAKIPGGLTYYHATEAGVAAAKLTFEEVAVLVAAVAKTVHPITVVAASPKPAADFTSPVRGELRGLYVPNTAAVPIDDADDMLD